MPLPRNISYWWNLGSLLAICLGVQVLTGLFLSIHFGGDVSIAFSRVSHITRDVNFGWGVRVLHTNGARLFFTCLYLHLGRGIYYGSYRLFSTWIVGVSLLLLVMATAFLGYVLPWGQISFWGATVITNLFSAIPLVGQEIVCWMWGGFAVDNATLGRFYSLHFLVPFLVVAGVIVHLFCLHQTGSNNPLGLGSNYDKLPFHPYFSRKDVLGLVAMVVLYFYLAFFYPWALGDPENFVPANPLVTPLHIQPEWYFLFAYAILRSIPNKLGGVVALVASVLIFGVIAFFKKSKFKSTRFYPGIKSIFWRFRRVALLLMWIGARPVEAPFIKVGQLLTLFYFSFFFFRAHLKAADSVFDS